MRFTQSQQRNFSVLIVLTLVVVFIAIGKNVRAPTAQVTSCLLFGSEGQACIETASCTPGTCRNSVCDTLGQVSNCQPGEMCTGDGTCRSPYYYCCCLVNGVNKICDGTVYTAGQQGGANCPQANPNSPTVVTASVSENGTPYCATSPGSMCIGCKQADDAGWVADRKVRRAVYEGQVSCS